VLTESTAAADRSRPLLEVTGLVKSFGGPRVLDGIDVTVLPGQVHALLGANGAGKSTLIKILSGMYTAEEGEITVRGVAHRPGRDEGIAFVHQDLGLIETASVAGNIALGVGFPRRMGLIDWPAVRRQAAEVLATVGCDLPPDTPVASLGRTERSLIAIARALVGDPAVLVLDEPTASLPAADVEVLADAIRRLRDHGVGIVYVSHRLDEVFDLCDQVTVLRDGKVVCHEPVSGVSMRELVELIVGKAVQQVAPPSPHQDADRCRLDVDGLVAEGAGPVSFSLGVGEIVGLVGLRGSGQESVGRALVGATRTLAGTVTLNGSVIGTGKPDSARAARIGFATSRREEESLAPLLTVGENALLNPRLTGRRLRDFSRRSTERHIARTILERFHVRPGDPDRDILTLSGGNQQKVVIGREMHAEPEVLVLEEPTMGVDINSKAEIYTLLGAAAANGCSVLVVSTDADDVVSLCHRALVMNRGRIVAQLDRAELTVPNLVSAISGADPTSPMTGASP
jgi:ribose transport system ATP-binding protein